MSALVFLGWAAVFIIAFFFPRTTFALAVGILCGWHWTLVIPLAAVGFFCDFARR